MIFSNNLYSILVIGSSYGSLLGAKLTIAGHQVMMVGKAHEIDLINHAGISIEMPILATSDIIIMKAETRRLAACSPVNVGRLDYDLVILAMQEPQYSSKDVAALLGRIAEAGIPCVSICNMPLPPYLENLPSIPIEQITRSFSEYKMWGKFNPTIFTGSSPDPQAAPIPNSVPLTIKVNLATNFKVAKFVSLDANKILTDISDSIQQIQIDYNGGKLNPPVKLKVSNSLFTPMAKWPMLITGNYRCVTSTKPISINKAVHENLQHSKDTYSFVEKLCISYGADRNDLVSFEKYAQAAKSLKYPSSIARSLEAFSTQVERVDRLMQALAESKGLQSTTLDSIVALVDEKITSNCSRITV